ncbi:MAG: hypothetical protein P1V35_14520, partial [Planctomycetota bacterium]|nr:hypothetical protein [Planctomycetota bacterium]
KAGPDRQRRIRDLAAALTKEGWQLDQQSPTGLVLSMHGRVLTVGAQVDPRFYEEAEWHGADTFASSPIGIQHFHPFTTDECLTYLNQRMEQGLTKSQLHALLAQLSPSRRQGLIDSYFDYPIESPPQKLALPFHFQIIQPLLDSKPKQQ